MEAHCDTLASGHALIIGYVTANGAPVDAAQVTVGWTGATPDWLMIDRPNLTTRTTADGAFAICNVPQDKRLRVGVRWGDRANNAQVVLRGTRVQFHRVDF